MLPIYGFIFLKICENMKRCPQETHALILFDDNTRRALGRFAPITEASREHQQKKEWAVRAATKTLASCAWRFNTEERGHRWRKPARLQSRQQAYKPFRSHRCEDQRRSACFKNSIDPAGPTGKPWADCTSAATLRSPKSACVGAFPCSRGLVSLHGLGSRWVCRNRGVEWEW